MWLAGGQQTVPDLARPLRLDVQLPAKLADVRDALGENLDRAYANEAAGHERKPGIRDVCVSHVR